MMRNTENTSQDVPTRTDRTCKETFSIRYYFVDNFLSRAETRKEGLGGESQKIKEKERKKTWAYLYKLCQGKQRRLKQIFKLLSFTYY